MAAGVKGSAPLTKQRANEAIDEEAPKNTNLLIMIGNRTSSAEDRGFVCCALLVGSGCGRSWLWLLSVCGEKKQQNEWPQWGNQ